MKIYGAGMAGLIAGHMLRNHSPVIHEMQDSLPNNHAALLRFRSDVVSKITGIPFRKVKVHKAIYHEDELHTTCNVLMANLYSEKVSKAIDNRSIWNLDAVYRYIAPPNFIELLANSLTIEYGSELSYSSLQKAMEQGPIISTIPMPRLMDLVSWKKPDFKHRAIHSITADLDIECDVYQTIYFTDPELFMYRASITGKHIILEQSNFVEVDFHPPREIAAVLSDCFGINVMPGKIKNISIKKQEYGKILSKNLADTQAFIMAMTDKCGIYSLGRFATWRQLLLDDIVNDCSVINRLIITKDTYEAKIK